LASGGFSSVKVDKCVYTKFIDNECVIISLYGDDMLIFGTCHEIVRSTKSEASVILGVKIKRNNDEIMLSQEHYIEKLLKKFGNFDVTQVSTPYDANTQLKKNQGDPVAQCMHRLLGVWCI